MHNIASYKKINRRCSLEISELNTQDISKFISHLWETIWYFRKCNIQENPSQPAIRMGFAHSNGDEMCYDIKTEKKIQSTSSDHLYGLDSGKLVQTRSTPMSSQSHLRNSMAWGLVFSTHQPISFLGIWMKLCLIITMFQGR